MRRLTAANHMRRRLMWTRGLSATECAERAGVHPKAITLWQQARGLAPNRPHGRPPGPPEWEDARRAAMMAFRVARIAAADLAVPVEQLEALEPWVRVLPAPDPNPPMTAPQWEALMRLADAHDAALRAHYYGEIPRLESYDADDV